MTTGAQGPIIIVGAPRSGTTMLRYMLSSHPDIYVPPESNFFVHLFDRDPSRELERDEAIRIIDLILGYKVFFRDWKDDPPDPREFVDGLTDRRPGSLIEQLYTRYAAQYGARRWGDKSPIYTSHVAEISRMLPDARFIHIVRDGRDVALSMLKSYQGPRFFYVDLCYAAQSWKRRVTEARRDGDLLGPEYYLEVRFEELTDDPEPTLRLMCEFIGEEFEPEMTRPEKVASQMYHSKGIHSSTRSAPSGRNAQKWKRAMSGSDQRIFAALAGDLLAELGYEVDLTSRLKPAELTRVGALQLKYALVEGSRRILRAGGVANPARLLAKR